MMPSSHTKKERTRQRRKEYWKYAILKCFYWRVPIRPRKLCNFFLSDEKEFHFTTRHTILVAKVVLSFTRNFFSYLLQTLNYIVCRGKVFPKYVKNISASRAKKYKNKYKWKKVINNALWIPTRWKNLTFQDKRIRRNLQETWGFDYVPLNLQKLNFLIY